MTTVKRWTHESAIEQAKLYNTKKEFVSGSGGAANYARRNGIFDQCTSHMDCKIIWNKDLAYAEAKKYVSRGVFGEESVSAWGYLSRHNLLDDACQHMAPVHNDFTKESVMEFALTCKTRTELLEKCAGGVAYAKRHGFYKEVCAHMDVVYKKWTLELLFEQTAKYTNKKDFITNCQDGYSYAAKYGLVDTICAHMPKNMACKYNAEDALEEAKKYDTQADFVRGAEGAWGYCRRNDLMDKACEHMLDGRGGYSEFKPAILYYLAIKTCDNTYFKIGVTNRKTKIRISGLKPSQGVSVEILKEIVFESGYEARELEKMYHKKFLEYRYKGQNILKSGNTEIYTKDVLAHYAT